MTRKTSKTSYFNEFTIEEVKELNSFDLTGERNKTKGTSNKMYHAELQISKNGNEAQIHTMYGPTGAVLAKEWRYFDDVEKARKEFNKIIRSKIKKGYKEIDVAQRAIGSEDAKAITKPVEFKNAPDVAVKSNINDGQKKIVSIFFGSQDHFVATTLKCPLGQLTNKQIDDGRAALDKAKDIINKGTLNDSNKKLILELTNEFYGLIPHNLGSGARGQMSHLILDSIPKIMSKESDLDTLLDAKQVNAVLSNTSNIDDKYFSLNCDFEEIDKKSDLFKFLSDYFEGSKVRQHRYDREHVKTIWKMNRKDAKELAFVENARSIAKKCGENTFVSETTKISSGKSKAWDVEKRPDLNDEEKDLYTKSNVWLSWHGTRSANLVGITRRGLLIRPSGAVYTGSMYGDGKYFAWQSSKSLNYCDGGYWTGGKNRNVTSRFMFLLDVAFGKMHHARHSKFFRNPPKGCHSVYAKAGGGVMNDEMITYDFDDSKNQSAMKYLFEIA